VNDPTFFHVGMIVPRLEPALEELTTLLGLTWRPTIEAPVPTHDEATGTTTVVDLRFAYSVQRPALEVIEAAPGSVWSLSEGSNLHHIGYFTGDVPGDAQRLSAARCPLEVCMDLGDGQRPVGFSYHRVLGIRIELVDRSSEAVLFG